MDHKQKVFTASFALIVSVVTCVAVLGLLSDTGQSDRELDATLNQYLDMMDAVDPLVRERGAIKYARIKSASPEPLLNLLKNDSSDIVRAAAALGIGNLKAYQYLDLLIEGMSDESPLVRQRSHMAIRSIFGVSVNFKADDPIEKRQEAIETIKQYAPTLKSEYEEFMELDKSQ